MPIYKEGGIAMKVVQKAKSSPKKYTVNKTAVANACEHDCKAVCKKCPPMTC